MQFAGQACSMTPKPEKGGQENVGNRSPAREAHARHVLDPFDPVTTCRNWNRAERELRGEHRHRASIDRDLAVTPETSHNEEKCRVECLCLQTQSLGTLLEDSHSPGSRGAPRVLSRFESDLVRGQRRNIPECRQSPRFLPPALEEPQVRRCLRVLVPGPWSGAADRAESRQRTLVSESQSESKREAAQEHFRMRKLHCHVREATQTLEPRKIARIHVVVEDESSSPKRRREEKPALPAK